MAMRLYTAAEFHAELREKWKLAPTDTKTGKTHLWRTPKGRHISIPVLPADERYPDSIIDLLVIRLNEMGENPLNPK